MSWWRWRSGTLLAASLLLQQGCLFKKAPRKASIVIPPSPPPGQPQIMAMPPQLPPPETVPPRQAAQEIPTLPPPTSPSRRVTPRAARRPVPAAVGNPGVNPPPTESAPQGPGLANPPTLQPILGSEETVERNRRINQYLERTRGVIARAERSNPTFTERELIAQVRTYVQQAEEARRVDLVRAENLAERAEVLSRPLVK